MFGYYTQPASLKAAPKAPEGYVDWQGDKQLGLIDQYIGRLKLASRDMGKWRSEFEKLKNSSDSYDGGQTPSWVEDGYDWIEFYIKPYMADDLETSFVDGKHFLGIDDNQILDMFPKPTSETLIKLDSAFSDVPTNLYDWSYSNGLRELSSLQEDLATIEIDAVYGVINIIEKYINMLNDMIKVTISIRADWQKELEKIAHDFSISDKSIIPAYLSMESAHNKAIRLEQYADTKSQRLQNIASKQAIEHIKISIAALKRYKEMLGNTPGIIQDDTESLDTTIQALSEIAGRRSHQDIRSWDEDGVRKDDAIIVYESMRRYWAAAKKQIAEAMQNKPSASATIALRSSSAYSTVPNYKFTIGEKVKVGNRYGKIVEASKEGGNGKQVYKVQLRGTQKVKECYTNEIKRA